jgi:hypothetical protein
MLPDFVIPGETKCGTTSLYEYLVQHPDIWSADTKEPRSFASPKFARVPAFTQLHYPYALAAEAARRVRRRPVVTGEASAEYLSNPTVARTIAEMVPDVKLVVLLRNPVTRAFSDYQMKRAEGYVHEPFETIARRSTSWISDPSLAPLVDAAAREEHCEIRFVVRGLYARSLRPWLDAFPIGQFLFLKSEDLSKDPAGVTRQVFRFLGVADRDIVDVRPRRTGGYDALPRADELRRLRDFYAPHNEALYGLLGRDLGWEAETDALIERSPRSGERAR